MELWEKIVKANNEIETITLKGKQYAEVKERIIAFRKVYPEGCIKTDINFTENYVVAQAKIYADTKEENLLANGFAREMGNKAFALETAQTSAIGRALGICGYGIKQSIASAEDIQTYDDKTEIFDEDTETTKKKQEELIKKFNKLSITQQANILNVMHVSKVEDIQITMLETLVRNA